MKHSEFNHEASSLRGLPVVLALALAPLVALGFSRFSYALLLPAMQKDLGWTLAQSGALNTANGLGYLLGALAAAPVARRFGVGKVFGTSMLVSALALLFSGVFQSWNIMLCVRFVGGVGTASAFVLGTALATRAMPQNPAAALAVYFAGSGMGMVLAGGALPHWLEASATGWQTAWILMGGASLLAAVVCVSAARKLTVVRLPGEGARAGGGLGVLMPSLVANALYGAGYVGYTTFVIALLRDQGYGAVSASLFFSGLGLASVLAIPLWGRSLARLKTGHGFAVVCLCVAFGTVPVLLSSSLGSVALSGLVFGASFMAGPAAVSLVAQRLLTESELAGALGALTAAFSLGQSVGPLLTGWIADSVGNLEAGLWVGPVLLVVAALASMRQSHAQVNGRLDRGPGLGAQPR